MESVVRITAEQLQFLIDSIRSDQSGLRLRAGWKAAVTDVTVAAASTVQMLGVNETRKVVFVAAQSLALFVYPGVQLVGAHGLAVQAGSTLPFSLSLDEWGWQLTQTWWVFNNGAGPAVLSVIEVFGPPAIGDV